MLTLNHLLADGYFPRELPSAFATTAFASAVTGRKGGLVSALSGGDQNFSELCIHNMVRSGGLRRHLGIPNPVHYSRQCLFVVQNWPALQQSSQRSPFSLTQPVDTGEERAISSAHSLNERTDHRLRLRSGGRFILKADINRFYSSIYTHSIPWAIEGKPAVKQAKSDDNLKSIWSNELDYHTRNLNDQQTVGIPIGPDTSLLLAELVLAAVDEELATKIQGLRGIRFIDDYEFALNQRSEAEKVVSILQSILSKYELALNPWKTKIIELPHSIEPLWTSWIRTSVFRDAGIKGQKNDLTAFFDNVFVMAKAEPNEDIFKFAIPRFNSVDVREENWTTFQNLLVQCAQVEPACLPQVCEQLLHYQSQGRPLDSGLWSACLNQIVTERLPLGQASEALWALWLMKQLGVAMTSGAEKAIDHCEDSAVALMALGMAHSGLGNPDSFIRLHTFAEPSELFGRHWLLCYEGNKQGWLIPPSGADSLGTHPAFDFFRNKNVSFFDINAQPTPPRRNAPGSQGGVGGGGGY
jgi:hypothetical protein